MKNIAIGGSDIATICGLNKFKTPYELYEDKISVAAKVVTEHTISGNILEPIILAQFTKNTDIQIHRQQEKFNHKEHNFLLCYVDGISLDGKYIISAKNTSQEVDKEDLPIYWIHQGNWEMGLSGINEAYVTWLSKGYSFGQQRIVFDEELFEWQVEMALNFWHNHIIPQIPPPPINSLEILQRIDVEAKPKEATEELNVLIGQLKIKQGIVKDTEKEVEVLKEQIKMYMVESDVLTFQDKIIATWKQNKNGVEFDKKALEETYPDVYEQFLKEKKGNRVLLIK